MWWLVRRLARRGEPSSDPIRRSDRRGAAAVELAVVSPLLLILFLGLIEVGNLVNVANVVNNASRVGARVAARNETQATAQVQTAIEEYLGTVYPQHAATELGDALTVAVTLADDSPIEGGDLQAIAGGTAVKVSVAFQFDAVRWLPRLTSLDDSTIRVATIMRRE